MFLLRSALMAIFFVFSAASPDAQTPSRSFVIHDVRVFDGLHTLEHQDVYVKNGVITAVNKAAATVPPGSMDGRGKTLLPGLIDAHHHAWLGVMRRLMPDVDDLFAYIDVVAEKLGAHYRPLDMHLSTKLTAVASLDAGITTIIDACHSSRSPGHTDAALDALEDSGIRALHMVGAAMDKKASSAHLPGDLKRLADNWNQDDGLVRVGVQSAVNRPETAALIRKLMMERNMVVPPPNRVVDSICVVSICQERQPTVAKP